MENYFTLLELPASFDLDMAVLERNYFRLQREHHPDRFVNRPQQERTRNMQRAATLNEAYHTLKNPLQRAEHMLTLQGVAEAPPDEELLTEAMRQREALAEAESLREMEALEEKARREKERYLENIGKAFAEEQFDRAANFVPGLKYAEKLREEIRLRKQRNEAGDAA